MGRGLLHTLSLLAFLAFARSTTAFAQQLLDHGGSSTGTDTTTPCGATTQMPGAGIEGKEGCTGNLALPFVVGPITITYNSQYRGYPNARPNYGFGIGMYAVSHIVELGDKRIFVAEDGTEVSYRYDTKKAVWVSIEDVRGDLSILRPLKTGYQLEELPSPAKTIYAQNVQGIGYFPTQSFDDVGGSTLYENYDGAVPTRVTDNATGKTIEIKTSNGVASTVVSSETIAGGSGRLSYALFHNPNKELVALKGPEGTKLLSYVPGASGSLSGVMNPFGQAVEFELSPLGRLKKVATRHNTHLVSYTKNSVTTKRYKGSVSQGSTPPPQHVTTTTYDDFGYVKEVRSGDGAASPGRRVVTITRDVIGRLTKVRSADGAVTEWFYNSGRGKSCETPAGLVGASRFPSCIKSGGFTTTITRNSSGLPTAESVKGPNGKGSTTSYSWDGTNLRSRSVKDSSGRETEKVSITYGNKFPISVTRESHAFVDAFDGMSNPTLLTAASGLQVALTTNGDGASGSFSVEGMTSEFGTSITGTGDYTSTYTSQGVTSLLSGNFLGTSANFSAGSVPNQADTTIVTGNFNQSITDQRETVSESLTLSDNGGSETATSTSTVVTSPDLNKTESTSTSRRGRL
jgi:YD repeat-containing protein